MTTQTASPTTIRAKKPAQIDRDGGALTTR
jgi:hypothetical protein